ncbi:hypothetical protein BACCIP111895_03919 [Neobacillus rhizosphaerae]|uniref:DUF4083 domain-containing protein n=1 Tax=Neobacillus rhizosphaerae TaxID=2880965 RepID=A0ABM9EVN0_9BACI|nr:hypothetical protein BACCIP111895_03919 [Neobacillus rhizosphaerae]
MSVNIGDIIFQLFVFLVPIILIFLLVGYFRSSQTRNKQIKRIEDKLDSVIEQESKR